MATPKQALVLLKHAYESQMAMVKHPNAAQRLIKRVVLCFWGHRGMSKSQMPERFASAMKLPFRSLHFATIESPGDFWGVQKEVQQKMMKKNGGKPLTIDEWVTISARPEWFPSESEPAGIMLVDEPNRANSLVRPLLLDFILNGRVGPLRQLPQGWMIVACCNPSDQGNYDVSELDEALMDRMIHVSTSMAAKDWIDGFARKAGIHEDLIDTIMSDESLLGSKSCSIPSRTPSPRSWELFDIVYKPKMNPEMLQTLACGTFGQDAGVAIAAMLSQDVRPIPVMAILENYEDTRERVKVLTSARMGRADVIRATIENLNTMVGLGDPTPKRLENLKMFIKDLSPEFRALVQLWRDKWTA